MTSGWFPFHYRDVRSWHEDEKLPISTSSDAAARAFDAAIAQLVLADEDPQMGGVDAAMSRVKAEDPDFILPTGILYGMEAMGCNILKSESTVKKIYDLNETAKTRNLSNWERSHLAAVVALSTDDQITACQIWEDILVDHPKDILALHLLYFGHLHTGRRRFLRDAVHRVVQDYDRSDRYFGHVHGKLCFGFVENGQHELAAREGQIALEHSPKDAWATHSVAHVYEETLRHGDGINFLQTTENNWAENGSLSQHIWWHKALHHLALGEQEEALTLFDSIIKPRAMKGKMVFPLSDATSLLLRLEMEGKTKDLKDRWRELGECYKDMGDSCNNVFYDFHALVATLFGGQRTSAERLRDSIREQATAYSGESKMSYNCFVAKNVGVSLAEATVAFADRDYEETVRFLNPVRFECQEFLGGSHAQKDVVNLMLLTAAVRSGKRNLAKQLFEETIAMRPATVDTSSNLHRLRSGIMTLV